MEFAKGNIRVFCRCRPLNTSESLNGCTSMIDFDSSNDGEIQVLCSDSSKQEFKFDHAFRTDDNQDSVFTQIRPIVTSVMDDFNVCIFAYGQTGTGKTYTMEGTPESRGVNYRTLEELFRISEERVNVMKYDLSVSMLEVYNEKIRDLLVDSSNPQVKKLEVKQTAKGTQEIPGLAETQVFSTEEVWELLQSGNRMRSVASTSANVLSSRSHCLLRVTVKGDNILNGQRTKAHLWLVDLAGSDRVGRTEVDGERLKELQFINKSLSALGDVISALASKNTTHIPYRNSKLTHLLQSSLGGDCKTLMIVQISPSVADVGETLWSLKFASRVRRIKQRALKNKSETMKPPLPPRRCSIAERPTSSTTHIIQPKSTPLKEFIETTLNLKTRFREAYVVLLNTASREELRRVKGIGEKRVDYIIELRNRSPLKSLKDLEKLRLSSKQIDNLLSKGASGIF